MSVCDSVFLSPSIFNYAAISRQEIMYAKKKTQRVIDVGAHSCRESCQVATREHDEETKEKETEYRREGWYWIEYSIFSALGRPEERQAARPSGRSDKRLIGSTLPRPASSAENDAERTKDYYDLPTNFCPFRWDFFFFFVTTVSAAHEQSSSRTLTVPRTFRRVNNTVGEKSNHFRVIPSTRPFIRRSRKIVYRWCGRRDG